MIGPYAENSVVCGDCLALMRELPDGCVDAVVTDPPYNVGYKYDGDFSDCLAPYEYREQQLRIIEEAARVTTDAGHIWYLNYPETAAYLWCAVQETVADLTAYEWVSWVYHTHTGGTPLRKATRAWLWFTKPDAVIEDESAFMVDYQNPSDKRVAARIERGLQATACDWWQLEQVKNVSCEKTEHPCQVPVRMMDRIVRVSSRVGALVLDPFLGSGTTAVACVQTGRRFLGFEINPDYCEIARRRIAEAQAQPRLFDAEPAPKPEQYAMEADAQ